MPVVNAKRKVYAKLVTEVQKSSIKLDAGSSNTIQYANAQAMAKKVFNQYKTHHELLPPATHPFRKHWKNPKFRCSPVFR